LQLAHKLGEEVEVARQLGRVFHFNGDEFCMSLELTWMLAAVSWFPIAPPLE